VSRRSRRAAQGNGQRDDQPFQLRPVHIAVGIAVLLLSAGAAIAIFTLAGGSGLSDRDPSPPEPPALGEFQAAERSAAADLLSDGNFESMTPDDLELVQRELARAFADAEFRVRDPLVQVIDVVRREGHTVATRQFSRAESGTGSPYLVERRVFFCPGADGRVDIYRYAASVLATPTPQYDTAPFDQRPMERLVSDIDWTGAKDLGFADIDGRRAHGVLVGFRPPAGEGALETEYWIDVENARLLRRREPTGTSDYAFDWRRPPRIETYPQHPQPPCASSIYAE
jgi:hypothetical protein